MTCVDPGELDSAILNLVLNARDAMLSGGRLSIATRNRTGKEANLDLEPEFRESEFIEISVSDTGVGMSPELQEIAFTPYFTTKKEGKGSGLGLSSVYGFATQSEGFAKIDSIEGRGTTVSVYLPHISSESEFSPTEKPTSDLQLGGGELILLVEDDEKLRTLTHKRLSELGYKITEAASAAEAITQLESDAPVSLVFSDIRMPGEMSGYDLAEWVNENRTGIPVLLTSGCNDLMIEQKQDARLLSKPYSLKKLACAIRDVLDLSNDG